MGGIFTTVLTQPLFNLLIWLHNLIPGADFGFAIIALTVIVKTLLWPLTHASLKGQKRLQDLQPKLEAVKAEHGEDKEAMAKAMMELYAEEKVNPMASCLPLLLQLPIIFALFSVLRSGSLDESRFELLYSFVSQPELVSNVFLGLVDLSEKSLVLAVLAGAFQFVQSKMLMSRRPKPASLRKKEGAKDEDMMASMNKSMLYFMPIVTVFIAASFPAGLALYWVTTNIVTIFQQAIAFGGLKKPLENKDDGPIDVDAEEVKKDEA